VGVLAQMHFYLDDIFPKIFRPIFSGGVSAPAGPSVSTANSDAK
jgi:hypothetical protein